LTKPIEPREIAGLLDQHAARLEFYAAQWTNAPEDCVQEAIVELAGQPVKPENVVAWLFRVVRNRALNQSRSQRRRAEREKNAARPDLQQLDPARRLQVEDEQNKTMAVLNKLPTDDRELVVLRIWSGLAWQEIAQLTGTSSSSAQRRYVAALEKMKQRLETKCPTNPD
jgi:RNA polymerase sigma-70 factor (ECF subfamily)